MNQIQEMPIHVEPALGDKIMQLVRLKNGTFHIWKNGDAGILLTGPGYIMVKDPFAAFLRRYCELDASFIEREVVQSVTGETCAGYYEVSPYQMVDSENIQHQEIMSISIWHSQRCFLFLSPGVCHLLEKEWWADEFNFSPGFSLFAAG